MAQMLYHKLCVLNVIFVTRKFTPIKFENFEKKFKFEK